MKGIDFRSQQFSQNVEKFLREVVGISELKAGGQVIRDENGWRQNETSIEYIWIVSFEYSSVGFGGMFGIKVNKCNFRQFENPEEFVGGIFRTNAAGECIAWYTYRETMPFQDRVKENMRFDLFDVNKGITLGGIVYTIRIISSSIDTVIAVNNPATARWKDWEKALFSVGSSVASKSANKALTDLFN